MNPYAVLNNIPQQVQVFIKNSELKKYLHIKLPEQNIMGREDFYLNEVRKICFFLVGFDYSTNTFLGFDASERHYELGTFI